VLLGTRPALTALVTRRSAELLKLRPGSDVFASFKAGGIVVLPP
jgi:molybdopterin-binding protein